MIEESDTTEDCRKFIDDQFALEEYLERQYIGVFTKKMVETHIRDYVNFGFASGIMSFFLTRVKKEAKILDVGSGFGAFTLKARQAGLDAYGIEKEKCEVAYARERIERAIPEIDAKIVFQQGDALALPYEDDSFDAICYWNVLEHIHSCELTLTEGDRVLRPDGKIFIICPNYAAFRMEAHYQVPWFPMFPRKLASLYLKSVKKNPNFFNTAIHYRTNLEIIRCLAQKGYEINDLGYDRKKTDLSISSVLLDKIHEPSLIEDYRKRKIVEIVKHFKLRRVIVLLLTLKKVIRHRKPIFSDWLNLIRIYNPFRESVMIEAYKRIK